MAPKLKIEKSLYDRLKDVAASKGYSSTDEFISHILETASAESDDQESNDEVRRRMQWLGYMEETNIES
jgi:metal-responsive CopG/Arc/MetJ family transcriptional regulator